MNYTNRYTYEQRLFQAHICDLIQSKYLVKKIRELTGWTDGTIQERRRACKKETPKVSTENNIDFLEDE